MFAIPVKTGDVLVFSYLGYKSQEVKIAAQTRLDIKLVPEANIMDEVVVVGYGAVKRGNLTVRSLRSPRRMSKASRPVR